MKAYRVKIQMPTGELIITIIADWSSELAALSFMTRIGECHLVYSVED
jgi:hypothetical protein